MSLSRKERLEGLMTLAGIYLIHFLLVRGAVATMPALSVVRPIKWLGAWLYTSWDAEHYLRLSQNFDSYAWPPLYPLVLRALSLTGLSVEAAAVLVNLAAHTVIVQLAYVFVRGNSRLHAVPGWLFASFLLLFPLHNVFFAAYSESLFVALLLGACVAYQQQRFWLTGLLCGLSLLTRNMGTFLGIALLLVEGLRAVTEKRFEARRIFGIGLWLLFFVGWNAWLAYFASTDPVSATVAWQADLLEHHVPPGESPKLWVLRFIAIPPGNHFEWVAFWGLVVTIGYCWTQRLRAESLMIAMFLLSFAVYLYRPFPFTRYASSLFPLALMCAHALRRSRLLQVLAFGTCVAMSHWFEIMLFSSRFGEP
jgi:hypothetical protein